MLNNGIFIILVLCVDNMLVASQSMAEINMLKDHMAREFDMKDLGQKKTNLGHEDTQR
jgi:hypothetical protein